jgi:pimeloyl-ACP methyl ester carboxylesterase
VSIHRENLKLGLFAPPFMECTASNLACSSRKTAFPSTGDLFVTQNRHLVSLRINLLRRKDRIGEAKTGFSEEAPLNLVQQCRRYAGMISLSSYLFIGSLAVSAQHPPGKMVDLGGHRLHISCSGRGSPTVIVENGQGDFSFDWILVQQRVSQFARICTYDRGGYAWSDPGPFPRTFAQINLELYDALRQLGENGPYVLVGHSYGGPVIRNFAAVYPRDVAGLVLVDAAFEGMRVGIGNKQTVQLGKGVNDREIPKPHEEMTDSDRAALRSAAEPGSNEPLDPVYKNLPQHEQQLQLWAQNLPALQKTEQNQREWSEVYFARLLANPQPNPLGSIPTIVLSRAEGEYESDLDVSALQMEQERRDGQAMLARLSTNSRHIILPCGHNMELEDPGAVADAIHEVINALRRNGKL